MNALLELNDVHVSYRQPGRGRLSAVQGVSLSLDGGRVLGLVGESGCGKSTIAKAVCGLVPVDAGTITFRGEPIRRLGLRRRDPHAMRIQMVFQNPYASLNPRRTVGRQIEDGLRVNPDQSAWTVADLLTGVELEPSWAARYPHQLSGGQRQRIAIARALAAGPDVLIGDEPIASLDASLQATIAQLMRRLALASGAGLLFISHDLSVVRVVADDVAVMSAGRIVEAGPVDRVWAQPQAEYTRRLLAAIPAVDGLGRLPGS
ncbi:ABC transporter ATP-binding protein [Phytoactinopolyspora limicola]|uniref:ABC transporter ATP-binding protein n=1 Tax=Phytoactinopolyspora limicola TaxID=2715536 RepID=UPI001408E16D|nr:ABC transporter ATP-binding protein [Phytoactinopolyspora limicola]